MSAYKNSCNHMLLSPTKLAAAKRTLKAGCSVQQVAALVGWAYRTLYSRLNEGKRIAESGLVPETPYERQCAALYSARVGFRAHAADKGYGEMQKALKSKNEILRYNAGKYLLDKYLPAELPSDGELAGADTDAEAQSPLRYVWRHWARRAQIIDPDEGNILMLTARRWGKTRALVEFLRQEVEARRASDIALIVQDFRAIDDVVYKAMLEHYPAHILPKLTGNKRRLEFPAPYEGVTARVFSADNYNSIRGGGYDLLIMDELAHWRDPESALDTALACVKADAEPRWVVATTPPVEIEQVNAIRVLERLKDRADDVRVGRITDNTALKPEAISGYISMLVPGSARYRAEVDGEFIITPPDALFDPSTISASRITLERLPKMRQVVIGLDIALTDKDSADETGIIVAGRGVDDDMLYVLDDRSGHYKPRAWAQQVVAAYKAWNATQVIAETNVGGMLVKEVLRSVDGGRQLRITDVRAITNKQARAEPVAARYEADGVRHIVGGNARVASAKPLTDLEEQMIRFSPNLKGNAVDDRVDALVYALERFIGGSQTGSTPDFNALKV